MIIREWRAILKDYWPSLIGIISIVIGLTIVAKGNALHEEKKDVAAPHSLTAIPNK